MDGELPRPFDKVRKHSDHVIAAVHLLLQSLEDSGLRRDEALAALKIAEQIIQSAPG
jgi:hypothetical protein